eukprot:gb/GECG01008567.1/.p1 GENE.gb/GECG01008567.1/~~gb/GECG01008567.1/.p1  ORF type:complete len:167 (+),score=17.40 gb/GECG01008567.1/:1-501(+)
MLRRPLRIFSRNIHTRYLASVCPRCLPLRQYPTMASGSANPSHKEDLETLRRVQSWEQWRSQAKEMVDYMADYYIFLEKQQQNSETNSLPVKSQAEPGYLKNRLRESVPEDAEAFQDVLQDVQKHIMPGITHWQHPSFFAYFSANSSGPGILGSMLSSMFNVIGFS